MLENFQSSLEQEASECLALTAKVLPERAFKLPPKTQLHPNYLTFRKFDSGFTLLELLAVITLIGLLATFAVSALSGIEQDSTVKITQIEMVELRKALRQFKQDVGHFPDELAATYPDEQKRIALLVKCSDDQVTNPEHFDPQCSPWNIDLAKGWRGPYVLSDGLTDHWGTTYRLSFENLEPRIISHGPNRLYEGVNITDRCMPNGETSDDLVLCLLK